MILMLLYIFCMFSGASSFDCDLSKWNVEKVTNMRSTLNGASVFNSDLSKWNVIRVTARHLKVRLGSRLQKLDDDLLSAPPGPWQG